MIAPKNANTIIIKIKSSFIGVDSFYSKGYQSPAAKGEENILGRRRLTLGNKKSANNSFAFTGSLR